VLVYLVRHGQSRGNVDLSHREPDCELTDLGERQAELVAAALRSERVTQVLTSPYRRTVETARVIAAVTGAPLALFPSFHEHHALAPAGWTPPSRADIIWRYSDLPIPDDMPETGWHALPETVEVVAARLRLALETLRSRFSTDDRVVVVSHASPIQQAIGVATGAYSPVEASRLVIGNASLTILDLAESPARLVALGKSDFLAVPDPVLL
jgi:broad specificity phosphatase PhoE